MLVAGVGFAEPNNELEVVLAAAGPVVGLLVPAAPNKLPGCEDGVPASGALLPNNPPEGKAPVAAGIVIVAPEVGVDSEFPVRLPDDAGLLPNNPPPDAGCVLPPPNSPPLEAGCVPPPPNRPPLGAAVVGVLELGVADGAAAPNKFFCSAGLEAALPNKPPPVAGAGVELPLALALPNEKLGVPVAWPKRLVVVAGFDEEPKREPDAGAAEVVALLD